MLLETQHIYTVKEFMAIAQSPENEARRLELIGGVIYEKHGDSEMAASSKLNTILAMRIGYYLNAYVIPNNLGYVTGADSGFYLDEHNNPQPDVAFISKARVTTLEGTNFDGPPDIAVEVVSSKSESHPKVAKKIRLYLEHGAKQAWIVYPEAQEIHVHFIASEGHMAYQLLELNMTLEGGTVLPGFQVALSDIFNL